MREIIHLCPPKGSTVMPCCGVSPLERALSSDRMTLEMANVTCGRPLSVQPEWCTHLPLQQQSVLLLAARGPDGIPKTHPCKNIQRAYRGTVLVAAARQRPLEWGEAADSFMSLDRIVNPWWIDDIHNFFKNVDSLPHHFTMHLLHGAEIIGYKHPDPRFQDAWLRFYLTGVEDMHLVPESEEEMDGRLNDHFDDDREAGDPHG